MLADTSFAPPSGLRWLYVDFNSYFASVEQQLQPRLRGKPVIVVPVATDSTCAIAASYEAKAFGVKTGTPVYEAKQKCPGVICVLAQHERYVEFHHRLLEEIDRHIPVTAVCSIDEVASRLMKNEAAPERATAIAKSIKAGIAANVGEYMRCSIGLSSNRYLAKVATDLQKPDGLVVLQPHETERLFALKLRDLPGIGHNMERRLNCAGIWEVKTLFDYQPRRLRAVWGSIWGEKMWYLLRGYDLPEEQTKRRSIGHSHVLAPEKRPPAEAWQVARRLTMKAAARLRRMEYHAGALVLSLRIENGPGLGLEARCEPAQDSYMFLRLLEALWREMMRDVKGRRIMKVGVTLCRLAAAGELQPDLFSSVLPTARQSREKCERISRAMDKLNLKFGRDTVLLGVPAGRGKQDFSGTKIAFTRIPDMEEFLE